MSTIELLRDDRFILALLDTLDAELDAMLRFLLDPDDEPHAIVPEAA